jgi:hypothetical protein
MKLPRATSTAARSAAFARQPLASRFARYESTSAEGGKVTGAVIGIDLGMLLKFLSPRQHQAHEAIWN